MNHEYRERDDAPGICAACGFRYRNCRGAKPIELSFLKKAPELADYGRNDWERWCARYGIDPNTPDESLLDAFLHGREPGRGSLGYGRRVADKASWIVSRVVEARVKLLRVGWRDDAQREYYESWEDYDRACARMPMQTRELQARAERVELERMARL